MASPLALPIRESAALDALRLDAQPLHGGGATAERKRGTWELEEPLETYPTAL